jgi:hypothetical protein
LLGKAIAQEHPAQRIQAQGVGLHHHGAHVGGAPAPQSNGDVQFRIEQGFVDPAFENADDCAVHVRFRPHGAFDDRAGVLAQPVVQHGLVQVVLAGEMPVER